MNVLRGVVFVLASWVVALAPLQGALDDLEAGVLLKEGSDLFRQANELVSEDAEKAKSLYATAAQRFELVVREGGIENGKIFYNIANAHFRAGDLGRAILNYRKAEQFDPNDKYVQQNLSFARSQRKDELKEKERAKAMRTLLFWHYDFSFGQRFAFFAIAFVLFWCAAAIRIFLPRPFLRWVIGLSGLGSAVLAASLVAESIAIKNSRPGVVIAEEVVARKGDSDSYEASFQEPLHAGAEFLLIEERKDWVQVELPDGRACWLPAAAVAMVR